MSTFPPFLFGPRVQLCLPTPRDRSGLIAFHDRNARFFKPWLPRPAGDPASDSFWDEWIGHACRQFEGDLAVNLVVRMRDAPNDPVIGQIDYSLVLRGPFSSALVGFQIDQKFARKGLMREALALSLDYMLTQRKVHRIAAGCLPENERSRRLLASLGFVEEGVARDFLEIDGKFRDHVIVALLSTDGHEKRILPM